MPVVHCKRAKYDVYIGRPGFWGNPFVMYNEDMRTDVIRRYELWMRERLVGNPVLEVQIKDLRGRTLGCYCAPKACHGDVLLILAEELHNGTK